jgi:hyperosmotically inducible protein
MKMREITKRSTLALAMILGANSTILVHAQSADSQTKPDNTNPDNTRVNKRDRTPGETTAQDQKTNATDRTLTANIRRAVVADKSLSTYAHNVKIISQDGVVTLKGPVRSDAEVKTIVSKATQVVGSSDKVVNQLSVKP